MNQLIRRQHRTQCAAGSLFLATFLCGLPMGFAAEPPAPAPTPAAEAEPPSGGVQERGVPGLVGPGSGILTTPTVPLKTEAPSSTVAGDTPSCTSWSANRFDCFVRGTDGAMYHAWSDGKLWAGWEFLGGALASKPSCVSWGAARIDCFARFSDQAMHHTWWDGSKWFFWESLGGVFSTADPICMSRSFRTLDCFARGNDGAMYHKWWDGSRWGGWESLGGVFSTADPTCVSWGGNIRLDCFARGNDGALYHKWWDGNRWGGWESLGGILTSNPSCGSWGVNRLDCFARGTDNSLFRKAWNGTQWLPWERIGGTHTSDPSCVSWGVNRLDCFARGPDGAMYHAWSDGKLWAGWENLGGILTSNPSCGSWGAARLDCFAQGTDGAMYHKWFDGSRWGGWEGLGLPVVASITSPASGSCYLPPFPVQPSFYATQTILETTYQNPLPQPPINLSSPTWARDVVRGRGMYDISGADPFPISSAFSSHGYSQNEWTQILNPTEDYEVDLVGLSGRAIIYDLDHNNGQSGNDVPFTHPFGKDWEFYIAPDDMYKKLAAPPAPPPKAHCEYAQSVIEAKRDFNLNVVNTLGVEMEQNLIPLPYRPLHGDRVAVWGRWIVDTGHSDFHTEIHPPLLLATGRGTSPDETTTTVIGRPYLVGQRWHDCESACISCTCVENGLMDHLFLEAKKLGSIDIFNSSTRVEAHPTIMPKAWQGRFFVNYTVKPPTPRMNPQDQLMVSFHFTVRTGVLVQLSNVGDAVSVYIMMNSDLYKRAPLPKPQDVFVSMAELEAMNADEASKIGDLYKGEYIVKAITSLGIGDLLLRRDMKTTRYLGPNAPPSAQTIHVPVNSVSNSPAFTINDNQPWPIAGTLTLTWVRAVPTGAPVRDVR